MSSRRRESISTVDRISHLPDSVICHILSLLPTKLAVSTSILSKRWIPLWKSVTTFDFDDECFQDFGSFCHFVDSVLGSRDATLSIQSFSMRCSYHRDFVPNDVNRSVNTALQRPIENFELGLSQQKFHPSLPKLAFGDLSCRTLLVLKLKNLALYHIPNLVDLPVLKTLHLDRIYFASHFVDVMNLFNGCPVLEDLHTNNLRLNHDWHDSKEDFKGFPFLVRANLRDCVQNFPLAWFHNAKFMSVEISLRSLFEYRVPTFHNLTHMKLFFYSNSWHGKWNWVIQVLQHCPNLQNLTIKEASYYVPRVWGNEYEWKNPKTVPECLSSQLRTCSIRRFTGIECELQFVKYIMLNSKLLHTMTIKSRYGVDEKAKHQMLVKLSSYPKGSVTCKLLFD